MHMSSFLRSLPTYSQLISRCLVPDFRRIISRPADGPMWLRERGLIWGVCVCVGGNGFGIGKGVGIRLKNGWF